MDFKFLFYKSSLFLYLLAATACGAAKMTSGSPTKISSNSQQNKSPQVTQSNQRSSSFSYLFDEIINTYECSTGKHTFVEKAEYCSALMNETLNRQCAKQSRLRAYRTDCTVGGEKPDVFGVFPTSLR